MRTINKNIEMIAVFLEDGSVKPKRFRLMENEEVMVIPIKMVQHVCEFKMGNEKARKFICLVEIDGIQRLCEIVYNLDTLQWILYKI